MADKDRIEGMGKQASGNIKEGIGKVIGDKGLEMKGKAEVVDGKIQNSIGSAKDAFKKD
jgi:uncharacterized protein YjbJ (UPF0337 family)